MIIFIFICWMNYSTYSAASSLPTTWHWTDRYVFHAKACWVHTWFFYFRIQISIWGYLMTRLKHIRIVTVKNFWFSSHWCSLNYVSIFIFHCCQDQSSLNLWYRLDLCKFLLHLVRGKWLFGLFSSPSTVPLDLDRYGPLPPPSPVWRVYSINSDLLL